MGRGILILDSQFDKRTLQSFYLAEDHHVLDFSEQFLLGDELGRGASGIVYRCFEYSSGLEFACKIVCKVSKPGSRSLKSSVLSEIQALTFVKDHPFVNSLQGVMEDSKNIYIMTEICEGGELYATLEEHGNFEEDESAAICKRIASALAYSHRNGIIHRDVKLENIFLHSENNVTDVRLGDFGSAAFFRPGQKLSKLIGSPLYIAPCVFEGSYGPEADMWSMGIVLYIMLSGMSPYLATTDDEILMNSFKETISMEGEPWEHISVGAKHLVSRLLDKNVASRITAKQIQKHPWIIHHSKLARDRRNKCSMPQSYFLTTQSMFSLQL